MLQASKGRVLKRRVVRHDRDLTGKELCIFGTAEMAELADYYFAYDYGLNVSKFVVDDAFVEGGVFLKRPVLSWSEFVSAHTPQSTAVHVALSYRQMNDVRAAKFEQVKRAGFEMPSYISSKAVSWPDLTYGANCFVLELQNLQPRVVLGNNVMLWSMNHIGHGSVIKDHAYLASGITVSGHVTVGEKSFIGVGAQIRDFVTIGSQALIGMGASVTKDVGDGEVVLGAQSTILTASDNTSERIKGSM